MEFNTIEEIYSIVFGTLIRDEGKIVSSKFNKLISEFGLDKVKSSELQEIYDELSQDKHLVELKDKAISGSITLSDVQDIKGDKPYQDKRVVDVVSTYVVDNKRRLSELREIRRQQEPHAYFNILTQDLAKDLKQELKEPLIDHEIAIRDNGNEDLLVLVSDIHVGYSFKDTKTGGYNFNILKQRLNYFLDSVKQEISTRNLNSVTIYFVGDLIEHVNMRNVNQAFDTEFTLSEQISKGTRLLLDFIKNVSDSFDGIIRFGMVGGNHDRLQGNKNEKIYNDNVAYLVLDTFFTLQENGLLNNIELIDNRNDVYTIEDRVGSKSILVNHGDNLKGNVNHIPKFIKDQVFDLLITGHVHHFKVKQEDYSRQHITVGSTIGYNTYSKELNLSKTAPSQQLVVLDKSKNITIKTVYLD